MPEVKSNESGSIFHIGTKKKYFFLSYLIFHLRSCLNHVRVTCLLVSVKKGSSQCIVESLCV